MPITIGSNIASLQAQRRLSESTTALANSYERLSSGQRINRASDDAAGLAIVSQLNAKSRIYTQGVRNLNDGLSIASIAEGSFHALTQIVTRLQELAEQSANGVYSSTQRGAIEKETDALSAEYSRITQTTTFNGINILDGSVSQIQLQGGDSTVTLNLASINSSNVIGTGDFVSQGLMSSEDIPNGEVIADFNGDGFNDIGVVHSFGSPGGVSIYLGNGNGTFKAEVTYASGTSGDIVAADLNHDGKIDLLINDTTGSDAQVLLGNGNGTFQAAQSYGGGIANGGLTGLSVGDLDGDGAPDIVMTYGWNNQAWVLINNGDGTFKAPLTSNSAPSGVSFSAIGDFNDDGKLDILDMSNTTNLMAVDLGNGDGTTQAANGFTTLPAGTLGLTTVGDVNGDGDADVVIANYSTGMIDVLLSNGDGTFKAPLSFGSGSGFQYNDVKLGDFNGDGKVDALVATENNNSLELLLGNGDGTFGAAASFGVGTEADTLAIGDLNNDGVLDAVVGDFQSPGHIVALLDQTQIAGAASGSSVAQIIALGTIDLSTQQGARDALTSLAGVQQTLANEISVLGAFESRVKTFINTLTSANENFEAAAGRIQDADIADESSTVSREQILQQSAVAVLAQANQQPALALKLLNE